MTGRLAPRPKRASENYARTHHQDGEGSSTKKPRFDPRNPSNLAPDANEEDEILEADVIGKGAATKRNAVNIDGYDSDSSNDNFDARADAKAQDARKSKEEEDQDMFADLEEADGDEEELSREGKKKKSVKFMENQDVEGAVADSKAGGHVSANFRLDADDIDHEAESSSDSGGDEERDRVPRGIDKELGAGHKTKHAPKLDAFNMKSEGEEGRFDENGNFVRKAGDPDAVHDTWLEGISKKDIKKAKDARAKREQEERQRRLDDDELLTSDLLKALIPHLELGETSLEALQRLNKGRKQPIPAWKQKKMLRNGTSMDVDPVTAAAEQKKKEAIDAITDSTTKLMNRGTDDIYEQERELLTRWYQRETGDAWVDPPSQAADDVGPENAQQFEFRYAQDPNLTPNGPYTKETLEQWIASGQFAATVEFKRVGATEWTTTI
ncbi:hypothetical protein EJ05DRAFT_93724 [Pseudovirgaria hyperparasitica]|uniref:GYF domain-containing protein n=1 Tax=Pseudovirgaria hyperparasitica TaxID=470096 RepID=A0A6A6W2F0_9PEZI|nr:uncharacterized protein EJ05DRAFT_93724 [Pseudovirgaria hyperparasitica]KAF2756216.1 hypothetical protein EJ05DRAFT_93724 [Pseudovirgaria hyperparasitica]